MPDDSRRPDHWDLMLESGDHLETWSLPELPNVGKCLSGRKLEPHRLDYLSYEGPISGNRGKVKRVVSGQFAGDIAPADSPLDFWLEFWIDNEQQSSRFLQLDETNWEICY